MKAYRYFSLLSMIALLSLNARAQFAKAEVRVSGMTCSMCQMATQKSLSTIDYINDIKPDLNNNSYLLTFRKNKTVDLDLLKKKVKDAGFSVSRLIVTFNFNKTPISNNSVFNYDGNTYRFMNVPEKILHGDVNLMLISNGLITSSDFKKIYHSKF